jgi:hypothetical protein
MPIAMTSAGLQGRQPTDMRIEQPTKFELAINLKTAKTFGLPGLVCCLPRCIRTRLAWCGHTPPDRSDSLLNQS